ncbi:MAG: GreA/GreB family elongation factor, partial [Caulobacteraceae bacterium]
ASGDKATQHRANRELRYWTARRSTAQLVEPQAEDGVVRFGATVTIERDDGRTQTFRITGEDEADPARGAISYVSPLARALIGKSVGDEANVAGAAVEITAIA